MYIICFLWIIFLLIYFNIKIFSWKEYMYCFIFIFVGIVSLVGLLFFKVVIIGLINIFREIVYCYDELLNGEL